MSLWAGILSMLANSVQLTLAVEFYAALTVKMYELVTLYLNRQ